MELEPQIPTGLKDSRGEDIYIGDKLYDKNFGLFIVVDEDTLQSVEEGQNDQDYIPLREEFVKTLSK